MIPGERVIADAIEGLKSSPGTFQRLIEHYAVLTYPNRFNNLIPGGRDFNDVTVKGWPDIHSWENGRMHVAEATHSPAWLRHLEGDLQKAERLGKGRLASFLFVAWDNEPHQFTEGDVINPRYEQMIAFRDRFVALDVPLNKVRFVFKKQLVRELAQPRFAFVLKQVLDLHSQTTPFRSISQMRELFGTMGKFELFAPAKEEYMNGLVHRASIIDEVQERLKSKGWAWIRGKGASGKTVLAIQVAFSYEAKLRPVYYLDLAKNETRSSSALDVITSFADEQVLFIVDNVHLDETLARDILNHWKTAPNGSHILLLGRETAVSSSIGRASPLEDFRTDALSLRINKEDLIGVFRRLAHRFDSSSDNSTDIPQDALRNWHSLFAGDLIAFSAAVAKRIKHLSLANWHLDARDATQYVKETYLDEADAEERLNLLRVAVLSQVEEDVPPEAIEESKLRRFLLTGVVHRVSREQQAGEHYRLVHPGVGKLLITAAGFSDEEADNLLTEQVQFVARQNPGRGLQIGLRLESTMRYQKAREVFMIVAESDRQLVDALTSGDVEFGRTAAVLTGLGILTKSEMDRKLIANKSRVVEAAVRMSLDRLSLMLEYAKGNLPEIYSGLETALVDSENIERLCNTSVRTRLDRLIVFLKYSTEQLPTVARLLCASLSQPDRFNDLLQAVLRNQLGEIVSFLKYAAYRLRPVYANFKGAFQQTQIQRPLLDAALRAPLDQLGGLLTFTDRKMPVLKKFLDSELSTPDTLDYIAGLACQSPLDGVASFLKTSRFPGEIISTIDEDKWNAYRLAEVTGQPSWFPVLAETFEKFGRPELAEAPACALIYNADTKNWHGSGMHLGHLSHVMRCGASAGATARLHFIKTIATQTWLAEIYRDSLSDRLAQSMFTLWGHNEQAVMDCFRGEALRACLNNERSRLNSHRMPVMSGAIQLMGCAALIGETMNPDKTEWPTYARLMAAIRYSLEVHSPKSLRNLNILLWLGLREMARLRDDEMAVDTAMGDITLSRWKDITAQTDKQRALNSWMIDWLERCAAAGWTLVSDHSVLEIGAQ